MHTRPGGVVCVTALQARPSLHRWSGPAEAQDVRMWIPEESSEFPLKEVRINSETAGTWGVDRWATRSGKRRTRLSDAGLAGVVRQWISRQQEKGGNLGNGKAPAR